ncbi:hypothetical protein [Streptacidiphilus sp. EB103A]|uniref:hypothetical protein n=1 Tax=Streptacidiphilus sp. EB103A TaxID=3156275 RepID=UPI003513FE4C
MTEDTAAQGTEAQNAGGRPPKRVGRARLVVGLIAALLLAESVLSGAVDGFRYNAELAGTPGVYTAAQCQTVRSGKYLVQECQGTFVPAGSGRADPAAEASGLGLRVGVPAELRRRSDGGFLRPDLARAVLDLSVVLALLSGLALVLFGAGLTLLPKRSPDDPARRPGRLATGLAPGAARVVVQILGWSFLALAGLAGLALLASLVIWI